MAAAIATRAMNHTTTTASLMMIALALVPCVVCAGEPAQAPSTSVGWFRRNFGTLTWQEIRSVVASPKDAAAQVRRHVRFREDVGDVWSGGQETWERGYGDCEDLAAAVVDLVRGMGQKAEILVFNPAGSWEAHAVAIGHHEGKMWISSNGWYETVDSLEDAKRVVARELGWHSRTIVATSLDEAASSREGRPVLAAAAK
jgi:hypothetical protein